MASTSARVKGVLNDSTVKQINKAIRKAGIDLNIEAGGSFELFPEGATSCIADSLTGHYDAYSGLRASEPEVMRLGCAFLIRGAI